MVRVNDRRGSPATAAEVALEISSYARQEALIGEAHRYGVEHGWVVWREPLGSPLTTLVMVRTQPTARLVFLECVPAEVEGDWRTWLEVPAALEQVKGVEVVIVDPTMWQVVLDVLT